MQRIVLTSFLLGTIVASSAAQYSIEVDLAYRDNYIRKGKDESFTRVAIMGKTLRERGSPLAYTTPASVRNVASVSGNNKNAFSFRYENGGGQLGGSLLEGLGLLPLDLNGLENLPLRGSLYVGGNEDLKSLQIAVGLETAGIRLIPQKLNTLNLANWLYLGISGQRQEDRNGDSDADGFLATYEAAIGKNYFSRIAGDADTQQSLDEIAVSENSFAAALAEANSAKQRLAEEVLRRMAFDAGFSDLKSELQGTQVKQETLFLEFVDDGDADSYKAARALRDYYRTNAPITPHRKRFFSYFSKDDYVRSATEASTSFLAIKFVPLWGWGVETRGWFDLSNKFKGDRLKTFTTATLEYWPSRSNSDVSFKLRYELGFERATPVDRKHHLVAMLSWRY